MGQIVEQETVAKKAPVQDTMEDFWRPVIQEEYSAVRQPAIKANNFELKLALITMVQQNQFTGHPTDLPVEIEYKAWWAIKKLNLDLGRAGLKRFLDINEFEELQNDAYLNSKITKGGMKKWHDQLIAHKNFKQGDQVSLYDSKLHLFPSKLKSKWTGPFVIHQVYPNGEVDLLNSKDNKIFKFNGQTLKPYAVQFIADKEEFPLLDPP